MIGIIDIGSNTVRLNIYKINKDSYQLLVSKTEMVGLAHHIVDGAMEPSGVRAAIKVLRSFIQLAINLQCREVHAFATASLRNISNSKAIVQEIAASVQIPIELLTGEQEAYLGFSGSTQEIDIPSGLLLDIGGGSTELVNFDHHDVIASTSIPMGSLTSYRDYVSDVIAKPVELSKLQRDFSTKMNEQLQLSLQVESVICIGGTARATFLLLNEEQKTTKDQVQKLLDKLSDGSTESKMMILKTVPDRIHTILPGLQLLNEVLSSVQAKEIYLSHSGVREGYLLKQVLGR